jgi:transcriptional regulator with XRE-family HTH domain
MSKVEVARAVGCDKSHYGNVENGLATPSAALAEKIAQFFGGEITEQQIIYPLRYVTADAKLQKAG